MDVALAAHDAPRGCAAQVSERRNGPFVLLYDRGRSPVGPVLPETLEALLRSRSQSRAAASESSIQSLVADGAL